MAHRTVDMELSVALAGVLAALADAGKYAGHGMRTGGRRVGRRARMVGTEAAARSIFAARALGGQQPLARRSRAGLVAVAAGAATVGVVGTLAARKAVVLLRTRDTGNGASTDRASKTDAVRLDHVVSAPTA
jgi:hypothetical protein